MALIFAWHTKRVVCTSYFGSGSNWLYAKPWNV